MTKRGSPLEDSGRPGSVNIDVIKMTRAQQNTRDLFKVISRPYVPAGLLKWTIAQTFSGTSDLVEYLKKVDAYVAGKVEKPNGDGFYTDPYEDAEFITELQNRLLKEWVELSREFDATSRVAMRDYMVSGWKFPYKMFHPEFYTSWMAGAGKIMILTGEKDSGKSDYAEKLAEQALAQNYVVLSNIELSKDIPNYIYCRTFSFLIETLCDVRSRGGLVLLLIDEAGLDFPSYEGTTTESKEHDKFHKLTRKFGCSEVFIIQYEHQVPFTLKKHHTAWVQKQSDQKSMRYYIAEGEYKGFDEVIMNVPATILPYDTNHISGMKVDIEIRTLLDFLDTLPPRSDQFTEMRNYLRMHRGEAKTEDIPLVDKKWLAMRLTQYNRDAGAQDRLPIRRLAAVFGVGPRTFRGWARDAEKGYGGGETPTRPDDVEDEDEDSMFGGMN